MIRIKLLVCATLLSIAGCGAGEGPETNPGADAGRGTEAAGGLAAPTDADSLRAAQSVVDDDAPTSSRFQLGTHYERLSPTQPTSSTPEQVEVAEVFWYGCPHCYTFDPYLKEWEASKPAYVNFIRIPAVWNPLVELHARAFYTAQALGKGEEMHDAFFTEIHENGNPLDSKEALAAFFGRFGVDEQAFETAFDSFEVHTKVQRANELSRRYRITSVPSVVVNGKYTANASMAGGSDQLLELVDELAASERSAD